MPQIISATDTSLKRIRDKQKVNRCENTALNYYKTCHAILAQEYNNLS